MSQQLGQPCQYALSLYTQTTEQLMKTFVTSQKQQDVPSQETPVGEVSVQVDLFSHPGTGEQKVSVKILAANDLRWQMQGGAFKPFVEVHLIGPYLADKKRKYATTTKSGNWAPKFNETFHFFLGNEGEPEHYELMFQVKDYCLTRADRIVGVGVLQLSNVVEQGEDGTSHLPEYTEKRSCAMWVQLGQRLHIDETGLILLRILSQRQNDSVAKEFVRLKSECRFETESTLADVDATNQLMIESCCEQPYHIQYTYLHEHLFQALCTENEEVRLPDAKGEDSFKICQMYGPYLQIFFDDAGQEIVDKFARRYGIEEIYQGMTHFACLCTRYMCAGVPAALSTLLANINAYYADTNAYSDRLASSNFGKDRFVKLIDELHNNLQVELSMYRKYFPSEQPAKLQDLKSKVDLLTTIDFFRMKVLELASPPRASNVVKKCVKLCMQATYKLMFESCCEQQPNKMITANSVQFWFEMIDYLMRAIEEDKNIYSNLLNQLPQELNVGQLCAGTMWRLYKTDLKLALEEHTMSKICETREYMNLYFRVNGFYFKYVDEIQQYKQSIPEFSAWFAPFFMDWLQENDEHSMDILRNAYNRDKSDNFPQISDTIKFSNSVVDVFSQLQEALKFLKQMDCPNPEVYDEIMRRFSKTLNKVLLSYADMVQKDFPRFASNATVAFILMNNVQQLSVQLENIYLNMGGAELDQDTNLVIEKLQKKLESVHDNLSEQLMATLVFPEERED